MQVIPQSSFLLHFVYFLYHRPSGDIQIFVIISIQIFLNHGIYLLIYNIIMVIIIIVLLEFCGSGYQA